MDTRVISSEKTLVFEFAWQLLTNNKQYTKIDFEKSMFEDDQNGKFLDLFIEYETGHKNIRIGIEFKFPRKTNLSNSGQTQVRKKVIHDVRRLCILKEKDKIDLGCFLFATNEKCYFNPKKESIFSTGNKIFKKGDSLPSDSIYSEEIKPQTDIIFNWKSKELSDGQFSFMDPVFIV